MRIKQYVLPLILFGGSLLIYTPFVSSDNSDTQLLSTLSVSDAFHKGQTLFLEEKFTLAEKYFRHCVEQGPGNADYLCWLAQSIAYELRNRIMKGASRFSLLSEGRQVRDLYNKAVELDPKNERALIGQAIMLRDVPRLFGGNVDKSERILNDIIKDNPKSILGHHFLGTFYIRVQKKYDLGIEYLKKAIEIAQSMELTAEEKFNHASSYHAIGKTLLENLNKSGEAVEYLEKSVEIDPDVILPWIDLSEALCQDNKLDKAKDALRKAVSNHTEHEYTYFKKDLIKLARKLKIRDEFDM